MSKYHNRKVVIDGHTFDSQREGHRYCELSMLERAGEISDLKLQPSFLLLDAIKWNGHTLRKRVYIADFMYKENGIYIVEDVKGYRTPLYLLKRHMFLSKYPEYVFMEV